MQQFNNLMQTPSSTPGLWAIIACVFFTMISASTLAADNRQPLSLIADTATAFIEEQTQHIEGDVRFSVKAPDRRLKLSDCSDALNAFLPRGSRLQGNTTVGIKCTHPDKYWTVYVSAKIEIFKPVVVAKLPLERKTIISAADVTTQRREVSTLRASYFTSIDQVVGKLVSRRFAIGAPLSSSAVKAPNLVKRGEQVTIIASINSVKVRMSGKALANGKAGETIKVRNNNSSRIIEGKVIKPGVVQVRI